MRTTLCLFFCLFSLTCINACSGAKAKLRADSQDALERGNYYKAFLSLSKLCAEKEKGACDTLPKISKDAYAQFVSKANGVCPSDSRECAVVVIDSRSLAKYEPAFNDYVATKASDIVANCNSEKAETVPQLAEALYCIGEADRPYDDKHAARVRAKRNILSTKLAQIKESTPMRQYTVELMAACASGVPVRPSVTDDMIDSIASLYRVRFQTKVGDSASKLCDRLPGPIVQCGAQGPLVDVRVKSTRRNVAVDKETKRVSYEDGVEEFSNPEHANAQAKLRAAQRTKVAAQKRSSTAAQECARNKAACAKSQDAKSELDSANAALEKAEHELEQTPALSRRQVIRNKTLNIATYTYTYAFAVNVMISGQKVLSERRSVEFIDRVVPAFAKGNIEGDPKETPSEQDAYDKMTTTIATEIAKIVLKEGLKRANEKPCDDWGCKMRDRLLNDEKGLRVGIWPEWSVHDVVRCEPMKN